MVGQRGVLVGCGGVVVGDNHCRPVWAEHCLSNLIRPRCAERAKHGRGKPVLIMHIGFFASFSRHISRTQSFQQNRHVIIFALAALKLLVSLISRLIACSARIVVDRQRDTQIKYYNPRCTCAPRVKNDIQRIYACSNKRDMGF